MIGLENRKDKMKTTGTKMYRKTTCKGCGYVQETTTSYYLDKKEWQLTHPNYHWNKMYLIQSRKVAN